MGPKVGVLIAQTRRDEDWWCEGRMDGWMTHHGRRPGVVLLHRLVDEVARLLDLLLARQEGQDVALV